MPEGRATLPQPKSSASQVPGFSNGQEEKGRLVKSEFRINQKDEDTQMNESLLMSFEEAARLLGGLHPNTLRQRKAGTENLTHVTGFGRRIMLLREEVNALIELKISQAHAGERDRRKILRMVS